MENAEIPRKNFFSGKWRIRPKIFPRAADIFSAAPDMFYLKRRVPFSTHTGAAYRIIGQVYFLKNTWQARNARNKGVVECIAITVYLEIFSNEQFYTLWLNWVLLVVLPTFTSLLDTLVHYLAGYIFFFIFKFHQYSSFNKHLVYSSNKPKSFILSVDLRFNICFHLTGLYLF